MALVVALAYPASLSAIISVMITENIIGRPLHRREHGVGLQSLTY